MACGRIERKSWIDIYKVTQQAHPKHYQGYQD